MSNQIDGEVHYYQLRYQTTPGISDVEGLIKVFQIHISALITNKVGKQQKKKKRKTRSLYPIRHIINHKEFARLLESLCNAVTKLSKS
jgi:hypothetical protein